MAALEGIAGEVGFAGTYGQVSEELTRRVGSTITSTRVQTLAHLALFLDTAVSVFSTLYLP